MNAKEIIQAVKRQTDQAGGLRHVYFIGCGGSLAAIYPGYYLLSEEGEGFGCTILNSNEFVHHPPRRVGPGTLCICCSLNATAETVEALKTARRLGAVTVAMTGAPDTGMARNSELVLVYSNGDDQVYSESNQSNVLRLAFELLYQYEDYPHYETAMAAFGKIDRLVSEGKEKIRKLGRDYGERFQDEPVFYILSSGPAASVGYTMSCCHYMEMQRKHAVSLHSGEYFHGPFETTDQSLPVILFLGVGRTRPLDERAKRFLDQYGGEKLQVFDARDFGLEQLGQPVAEYFTSPVMIPIERYFVQQMAEVRGHSMDLRRYMWKFAY